MSLSSTLYLVAQTSCYIFLENRLVEPGLAEPLFSNIFRPTMQVSTLIQLQVHLLSSHTMSFNSVLLKQLSINICLLL